MNDDTAPAFCPADEAHRHLYHPWWSVKEMEAIAALAHRHQLSPVEFIREAVGGWDQARKSLHLEREWMHQKMNVCRALAKSLLSENNGAE